MPTALASVQRRRYRAAVSERDSGGEANPDQPRESVTDETRVEPNQGDVAAKVYEDEVVLMHLGTGVYANIEALGATVWECVEKRHSVREIAAVLTARFDVDLERALGDIRALITALLGEELVCISTAATPSAAAAAPAGRSSYTTPTFVVYRDMEDLLALDPPLPQYAEAPWRKS